jgi:hypothetical protein
LILQSNTFLLFFLLDIAKKLLNIVFTHAYF